MNSEKEKLTDRDKEKLVAKLIMTGYKKKTALEIDLYIKKYEDAIDKVKTNRVYMIHQNNLVETLDLSISHSIYSATKNLDILVTDLKTNEINRKIVIPNKGMFDIDTDDMYIENDKIVALRVGKRLQIRVKETGKVVEFNLSGKGNINGVCHNIEKNTWILGSLFVDIDNKKCIEFNSACIYRKHNKDILVSSGQYNSTDRLGMVLRGSSFGLLEINGKTFRMLLRDGKIYTKNGNSQTRNGDTITTTFLDTYLKDCMTVKLDLSNIKELDMEKTKLVDYIIGK